MPSTKHTYRITLPDGAEATRTTARTYTHVIACQTPHCTRAQAEAEYAYFLAPDIQDGPERFAACVERKLAEAGSWAAWDWCGRPDLAAKAADKRRRGIGDGYIAAVQVIEIAGFAAR